MSDCMKHAWEGWCSQHRDETEAGVALFNQLLDVTGQHNATVLQLTRLRSASQYLVDILGLTFSDYQKNVRSILDEPLPAAVPNAGSEALKEQAQRIRELEIANAGLQAKVAAMEYELADRLGR